MQLFFPFNALKTEFDFKVNLSKRTEVVEMVKYGEITENDYGNATLPNRYKKLSQSGEIQILRNDTEITVIKFWTFRGLMVGNSYGFIYISPDENPTIELAQNGEKIFEKKKMSDCWYYVGFH